MDRKTCWLVAPLLIALTVLPGCSKKGDSAAKSGTPAPVNDRELAGVRTALARGMQPIGFVNLNAAHTDKGCLVEARTPDGGLHITPPPPPPGMIQRVGQVTFYRGELDGVSSDALTIRKAYPTAGNFKKIEIAKADIRAIYLAP